MKKLTTKLRLFPQRKRGDPKKKKGEEIDAGKNGFFVEAGKGRRPKKRGIWETSGGGSGGGKKVLTDKKKKLAIVLSGMVEGRKKEQKSRATGEMKLAPAAASKASGRRYWVMRREGTLFAREGGIHQNAIGVYVYTLIP